MVKQQTLMGAVIVSLILGFVAGTVFSSFKLKSGPEPMSQQAMTNPQEDPHAGEVSDPRIEEKILHLNKMLEENPENAEAWVTLGNLYYDTHQFPKAIQAYEKALTLDPDNAPVRTDLGTMYRRNKEPKKALEQYDKVIAATPDFHWAYFNKGLVLMHDLEDPKGGIAVWKHLLEINPLMQTPGGRSLDEIVREMVKNHPELQ